MRGIPRPGRPRSSVRRRAQPTAAIVADQRRGSRRVARHGCRPPHRIAGMLRPGGVLRLRDLVYDATPAELPDVLAAWFEGAVDDPAAGYTAEDLAEHVRTEFSTFSWLLGPMLDAAGFDIVERDTSRRTFAAYTCVRR